MNKTKQKGKWNRILRISLITFSGLIMIGGIAIFFIIQNYMNKINMIHDIKTDAKALETDVYYDNTYEIMDGNSYEEYSTEVEKDEELTADSVEEGMGQSNESTDHNNSDESGILSVDGQVYSSQNLEDDGDYQDTQEQLKSLDHAIERNVSDQSQLLEDDNISNILFIVSDADTMDRSIYKDSIILLSVNQEKEVITVVSFSEDIYLQIPGNKNSKLTTAYLLGGAELLMETLQINFKIKVDSYITGDNDSFQALLDTIGGVKLNVEKMDKILNTILPRIITNLNENQILAFVLMMPTYMNYEQKQISIPLEGTFESYYFSDMDVLGIDFDNNRKELSDSLY